MTLRDAIIKLRDDALARDLKEAAIVYGWSLIRLNDELIGQQVAALRCAPQ